MLFLQPSYYRSLTSTPHPLCWECQCPVTCSTLLRTQLRPYLHLCTCSAHRELPGPTMKLLFTRAIHWIKALHPQSSFGAQNKLPCNSSKCIGDLQVHTTEAIKKLRGHHQQSCLWKSDLFLCGECVSLLERKKRPKF